MYSLKSGKAQQKHCLQFVLSRSIFSLATHLGMLHFGLSAKRIYFEYSYLLRIELTRFRAGSLFLTKIWSWPACRESIRVWNKFSFVCFFVQRAPISDIHINSLQFYRKLNSKRVALTEARPARIDGGRR